LYCDKGDFYQAISITRVVPFATGAALLYRIEVDEWVGRSSIYE